MVSLSRAVLPRVRETLLRRCRCPHARASATATSSAENDLLHCTLSIGSSVTVPLTMLGCASDEPPMSAKEVFVHSPGLAGAFALTIDDLATCRGALQLCVAEDDRDERGTTAGDAGGDGGSHSAARELGMVCLMEALQKGTSGHSVLQRLYSIGRRRHFAVRGATRVMQRGAQLNVAALRCDFPYHVGGAQASKEYLDIRDEVCDVFAATTMRHGTKVLCRYGIAVSVGVRAQGGAVVRTPSLLWHPAGASAACLAMVLHGCRLLPLDVVQLEYNGPTSHCPLLHVEDVRRYMQVEQGTTHDRSAWLCAGLFGYTPGQPWSHAGGHGEAPDKDARVVAGVTYDAEGDEFELLLRDTDTGALTLADDVAEDSE